MIAIVSETPQPIELTPEDRRAMCAEVRCRLDHALLLQPYARLSKVSLAIALVWQEISRLERALATRPMAGGKPKASLENRRPKND